MSARAAVSLMLGVAVLVPVSAEAGMPIYDRSVFPNPTIVDFESLDLGLIGADDNLILASDGILFPTSDGESVIDFGQGNKVIDIVGSGDGSDGLVTIEFIDPVLAAGVDYWTGSELTFTAYSGTDIVGTATSSGPSGFFGVDGEGASITSIAINDHAFGFQIDDLTYGAVVVPIPAAVLLSAIGLAMVGWMERRFC